MNVDVMEQNGTIGLTESAAQTVKDLLTQKNAPDHGLRVFVSGGGCSGLQYGMALEAEARPYDHVIEAQGVKLFVDPTSMMYLSAATIDYEDSIMGGGFRIDNPQAAATCGCGHSFKPAGQEAQSAPAAPANGGGGGCGCG
jgi:iron-sulfur cluster assembly accessory protein